MNPHHHRHGQPFVSIVALDRRAMAFSTARAREASQARARRRSRRPRRARDACASRARRLMAKSGFTNRNQARGGTRPPKPVAMSFAVRRRTLTRARSPVDRVESHTDALSVRVTVCADRSRCSPRRAARRRRRCSRRIGGASGAHHRGASAARRDLARPW